MTGSNPVHIELPGTEATMLYDEDSHAIYVKLREEIVGALVTQTVIENPMVKVDLRDGEAVGIEIVLEPRDES